MKFLFNLRPVNALDFYNFFKIDLLKIPKVAFSENWEYNSVACSAYIHNPKKKFRCFDLKPDGPFSAVCSVKFWN